MKGCDVIKPIVEIKTVVAANIKCLSPCHVLYIVLILLTWSWEVWILIPVFRENVRHWPNIVVYKQQDKRIELKSLTPKPTLLLISVSGNVILGRSDFCQRFPCHLVWWDLVKILKNISSHSKNPHYSIN